MSLSKQRTTEWCYSCEQSAVFKFANAYSNTMVGSYSRKGRDNGAVCATDSFSSAKLRVKGYAGNGCTTVDYS